MGWLTVQLPRSSTRLSIGPTQHPCHGWSAGAWSGSGQQSYQPRSAYLHDTWQQWDVQEESQRGSSANGVVEIRGLKPNQWFFVMNAIRGLLCKLTVLHCNFHDTIFLLFLFFPLKFNFVLLSGGSCRGRVWMQGYGSWMGLWYIMWKTQRIKKS